MAATWVARSTNVQHAYGRSLIDVFNAAGSGRVVRVYTLALFNTETKSSNDEEWDMELLCIRLTKQSSGGTSITPLRFDTANAALPSQVTCGTNRTVVPEGLLRRFVFLPSSYQNNGNIFPGGGVTDNHWPVLTLLVPYAEWGRYGNDILQTQPIVCRSNQGCDIGNPGPQNHADNTAQGNPPVSTGEIIFTESAS